MPTGKLNARRVARKLRDLPKPPLHFLHISKTGGTAIRHALRKGHAWRFRLVRHEHDVTLPDIPVGEKVFFVVRDPAARFVSGFNSRFRKGGMAHPEDWSPAEERAFTRFRTPDELARALAATDPETAAAAEAAVNAIIHTRRLQVSWVGDLTTLRDRRRDVLLVGRQWALDEDFARLTTRIGMRGRSLPASDVAAHRTPRGFSTELSAEGLAAVRRRYAADYDFLAELERLGPEVGFAGDLPAELRPDVVG